MKKLKYIVLSAMLSVVFIAASAFTDDSKETERVYAAANVLKDFGKMKETIPHDLISEYQGIIIIPRLINAGLGIGGKRGKGVALVKLADGKWSDPVFVTMTGGSIGPQIGVQSVDLVLVFRHKGVLTKVKNGDVTIGGDASAAAGPVGRSTSANTDFKLQAEVYSYSRSKGLFAGVSLNGTSINIDKSSNAKFYGDDYSSKEIFDMDKNESASVKELKGALGAL